ncbi:dihydrodipicolinate synthase family protein [Paracoccus denitrificans]|uniref:dihydrodipicolinate synthase family protein n=1 Tax=Paracoccus denitrificans TaxID=266 RepID=UPI000CECD75B|nr:dihydrodipicolinate synthase family protein [Paracoccus denitrificans]
MAFEGILTPVMTPYNAQGEIDFDAYSEILEAQIAAKVHAIIVAGSTGEYYVQTQKERFEIAEHARKVVGNRLPLIVGTGAIRTEDSIEYAKHAREIGADAILITTPPYAMPTEEENAQHTLAIDKAAGLPAMLYNYPARMGVQMGEKYFRHVSASKNIVGIKESTGSTDSIHLLALKFPNIALSCGWDDQAIEFFAWGARSWVCGPANFIAPEAIALYEACVLENDFAKGRAIMGALMPLMELLETNFKFVPKIKYGCELIGLPAGIARKPLGELNEEEKALFKQVVTDLQANVAKVLADKQAA